MGPMLLRWFVLGVLTLLSTWLWVEFSLSLSIFIACAVLLVEATPSSLVTLDDLTLPGCRNILILFVDVAVGLFDSLIFALLALALSRCF